MATLRGVWGQIREKHWRLAESSGSLGIIGIIALILAFVALIWKRMLGKFSLPVAFVICLLVPLLNL